MSLNVYLYFSGNCREAFDHYLQAFGALEIVRQTYADAPEGAFPDEPPEHIMHTTIKIGDAQLMGSDRGAGCQDAIVAGSNFAIAFRPDSIEQADRVFPQLAEGGEITLPLQQTFWGSYYGLCTDRFGIDWMFNMPLEN